MRCWRADRRRKRREDGGSLRGWLERPEARGSDAARWARTRGKVGSGGCEFIERSGRLEPDGRCDGRILCESGSPRGLLLCDGRRKENVFADRRRGRLVRLGRGAVAADGTVGALSVRGDGWEEGRVARIAGAQAEGRGGGVGRVVELDRLMKVVKQSALYDVKQFERTSARTFDEQG